MNLTIFFYMLLSTNYSVPQKSVYIETLMWRAIFYLKLVIITSFVLLMVEKNVFSQSSIANNINPARPVVALLTFENMTGNPSANFWGYALKGSIFESLQAIKSLSVLSSGDNALYQLDQKRKPIDDALIKQLGKSLRADWVVWGNYKHENNEWEINLKIFNVAGSKNFDDLILITTNWVDVQDQIIDMIVKTFETKISQLELLQAQNSWTTSSLAFENYGKAIGEEKLEIQEKYVRQALEADPKFAEAKATLAAILGLQGKTNEGQKTALEAIQLKPDDAFAYKQYGLVLFLQKKFTEAEKNFQIASLLDPNDSEATKLLGDVHFIKNQQAFAIKDYNKAIQLNSFAPFIPFIKDQLKFLDLRQSQTYITNSQPVNYTEDTLAKALKQRLTDEEITSVVNPLYDNSEMKHWAYQITKKGTNDLQKAKMLFDEIIQRENNDDFILPNSITAQEVFRDWNIPEISLYCQQRTFLFIALARAIGIKAFAVNVQEAYDGNKALHLCAAVYFDKEALLVDPIYAWFGVPHKKFMILDDLQVIATHLSTLPDLKQTQIARKLAPNLAFVQYNYCKQLIYLNQWDDVQNLIPLLIKLDSNGEMADLVQASIAMHNGNFEQANYFLNLGIKINPDEAFLYIQLGNSYAAQSKFTEARNSFQIALHCLHTAKEHKVLTQAIKRINEKLL